MRGRKPCTPRVRVLPVQGPPAMTLRIVTDSSAHATTIRLIGRMQLEHVDHVRAELAACGSRVVLDLDDLTLADVEAVRFLAALEQDGVELQQCPPFVREWIVREAHRKT